MRRYNWNRPSVADLARAAWNPGDRRIWVPKRWGWGYDLNVAAIVARLRRRRSG